MESLKLFSLSGDAFYEAADDVLDVDQWLRAFAVTVLWGVGDNYSSGSQHNGYFYIRPADGRMLFLPWDVDFTASQGATSTLTPNPELRKLVGLPENRHYYYGHIHDVVTTSFNESYMNPWIDHYEQFLTNHNFQSFKSYIRSRSNHALNTINSAVAPVDFEITTNDGNDILTDMTEVSLGGNGWVDVREVRLAGSTEPLDIRWPEIDEWAVSLPVPEGTNDFVFEAYNLRGELIGTDTISVTANVSNPVADSLRITEINYHPHDATATELASDPSLMESSRFEFIEFANVGSQTINPVGVRFTTGIEFAFPSIEIAAGERVVVVSNSEAFELRYGSDVTPIGEFTSGRLANGGENLTLVDALGQTLFDFRYNDADPWPVLADGFGATLESDGVTSERIGKFYSWRASSAFGGSPGEIGEAPAGIVINEVLAHTDPPVAESDSIELLNTSESAINIGGWYLSDAASSLLKYQVPDGTVLGPGEYVVFDESDFNRSLGIDPQDFALSGTSGDDVYLVAVSDGQITSFVDAVHFDDSANGESFGRIDGYDGVVPMTSLTLGAANSEARVGPLVFSEINYVGTVVDGRELEFVEVYNPSDAEVDLTDWRIRGGIDFNFDPGTVIASGETLIVFPFNPGSEENSSALANYRLTYGFFQYAHAVGWRVRRTNQ